MLRSLPLAIAGSVVLFAVGCGDASAPSFAKAGTPVGSSAGAQGSQDTGSPSSASSSQDNSQGTAPTPPPAPAGNVYFRVANLFGTAADACVSSDGGKTFAGPIMHDMAGKSLDAATVSARVAVKNAHFVVRAVTGADCKSGTGADVLADVPGEWPATIVLGQKAGKTEVRVLTDEPSLSGTATFVRLVHAASWAMDADLGSTDDDGDYVSIFGDTPFLGTAKQGTLSPQGYVATDPLAGTPLVLRTTTSKDVRLSLNASTDVNEKYSLFTLGDDTQSSLLACDDAATPGSDHLTPCTTLGDGDTLSAIAPLK